MINHPYFTPFVTFVLALAIGLYLQLHLHIIPDLSIKDPDCFISTNSGQEDDDSSTSASKSSTHLQQNKNKNNDKNKNNNGIDASGWNQWHHIRHWPDEGALWPSPRHSHAATSGIFDHEEMMFVFGGVYGNNNEEKNQNDVDGNNNNNLPGKILGDLWRYDEFHDRWYPVAVSSSKDGDESGTAPLQPAPRFDASLLSFDNGHKLVLTGGYNFGNNNAHSSKAVPVNDGVWIYDIAKNSWSVIPNNNINDDDSHSSCVPTSKNTFIIGSDLSALCIGDRRVLKKFSLSTKPSTWKKVPVDFAPLPSATATKQQSSSSSSTLLLTKLSETEILFFIDGKEWILDFSSEENHQPQFLRLSTIPPSPSSSTSSSISQSNTCIITIKHLVFVFGGITSTSSPSTMMMINDDFHVLNLETRTWKKITKGSFGRSTRPPPTFGHSCVRIRDDKVVMVGGRTSVDSPGTSDVWEFWFSETDVNGIY